MFQLQEIPPAFLRNPYPFYQMLRGMGPVVPDPTGRFMAIDHKPVSTVLRDRRFITKNVWNGENAKCLEQSLFARIEASMMLHRDPPAHTRLRALVSRAFTPKIVADLASTVQLTANGLIDAVGARGEMDVIADFAYPLPVTIIAEMLGVPHADMQSFRTWSKRLTELQSVRLTQAAGPITPALLAPLDETVQWFVDYLEGLVEERRKSSRRDLLSALVVAEEAGDQLSADDLMAMVVLLLVAGHETTMNLIGNGLLALLRNPAERARLEGDPSLAENAVEELLRFDSPVQITIRVASVDVELESTTIPAGAEVIVMLGAANRDPERYAAPDKLDLRRKDVLPISFGGGIHYCLGAPLARLEGRIALPTLLCRLPGLSLRDDVNPDELAWNPNIALRGLQSLPVVFRPA